MSWNITLGEEANTTTSDATATTAASVSMAEDTAYLVTAHIVGAQDDYSDALGVFIWGVFKRASGGNVTLVGSLQGTVQEDSSASPTATLTANTTNQTVDIDVTGVAAEDWSWRVMYTWVRV